MQILQKKQLDFTPIFLIGNVIVLSLLLIVSLVNSFSINSIVKAKPPTLVELSDGGSIRAIATDSNSRTPQAINDFVGKTMVEIFSWNAVGVDNLNPTNKPQLDPGVETGEDKITTRSWAAGFALSEDFRGPFLKELATITPDSVFTGTTQSILIINHLSTPTKINEGSWTVKMVANLIIFQDGEQLGKAIAFNKTIFVRAVDSPQIPKNSSPLQQAPYSARKAGLEIYKIQDIDLGL
ncbi:hypothetical protein WKK05_37630 (plasmid) [Nostoc sp. UHCC 0302]|uniref:hypothetical protein n=1 Tax=Nostoc sp. UHCC 0302 TaxID=3134896 RepID=UPI00311C8CA8